jgi:hypothetical protein
VAPLPEIASAISGKTYVFDENPLIEWLRLDFSGAAEATVEFKATDEETPRVVSIGLDGLYRSAREGGLPSLGRGYWEDEQTFVVDYSTLPNVEHFAFRLNFDGDRLTFDLAERVYGTRATLEGAVQDR